MAFTALSCQQFPKMLTCSSSFASRLSQRPAMRPARVAFRTERPYAQAYSGSAIPTPDEDKEVAHSAFLNAFQEAQPERARIPGMQEFASAILARSRIPSQQYSDPLKHIFDEFDVNHDGCLEAHEIGEALRSRNVNITDEQVSMFIDAVDLTRSHQVHQSEFRDFILHMAAADLHSRKVMHDPSQEGDWVKCTLESDDEIQDRLKSWIDNIMLRRYR